MTNITIYGTLSALELIWLLVNIPGFLYSFANSVDARGDSVALEESGEATNKDWIIVRQRRRHADNGTGIQLFFVVFGVASALTPNQPDLTFLSLAISAVLIGGSFLLSFAARKDFQDRQAIRRPERGANGANGTPMQPQEDMAP